MKKFILIMMISIPCEAGLITHTDYQAGGVITSAGQNANENAIFNEFNGNIDNTNIKTGGIVNTNILSGNLDLTRFTTVIQSSFTALQRYSLYKRPALQYVGSTLLIVENNTSTSNQTCVIFPDTEQRCVTNASGSRQADITAVGNFTSGDVSGMAPGETRASFTWYAVYAVKSQNVNTLFDLMITTNTYSQANMARLNTLFGSNAWAYLGLIRLGDWNGGTTNQLVSFVQTGDATIFNNDINGGNFQGVVMSSVTAGTGNLTYTYSAGTTQAQIPSSVTQVTWLAATATTTATGTRTKSILRQSGSNNSLLGIHFYQQSAATAEQIVADPTQGVVIQASSGTDTSQIIIIKFWDSALGSNYTANQ